MSELRFDGKVAVVTGGGRGLGRDYALLLAARGAKVVVNDNGSAILGEGEDVGPAQSVVDEITALGGEAVANVDSVATEEGGAGIIQSALDTFGRISWHQDLGGHLFNYTYNGAGWMTQQTGTTGQSIENGYYANGGSYNGNSGYRDGYYGSSYDRDDRYRQPDYAYDRRGNRYSVAERPGADGCSLAESPIYLPDGRVQKRFVRVCQDSNGNYQVVD